jgi:signal transduction histidine kinase
MVGCGVDLADAPKEAPTPGKSTAPELMTLVREAAAVLEERGEQAYPEFRKQGSRWFHDDTYLWVVTTSGVMPLNAAEPELEGMDTTGRRDIVGRPFGRMIQEVGAGPSGEGWVHYLYTKPGGLFPTWKSTFVKRVTFPSGTPHIVGCGIYDMQMDRAFIEDVVGRAAALVAERGSAAFGELRDRTGPFVFMDTYVFVQSIDGTKLVNPAQPSLEGRNLIDFEDLKGKPIVREEIEAAIKDGSAWVDCYWYRPGDNTPARKATYVRKVQSGPDTYIVGSGIYVA